MYGEIGAGRYHLAVGNGDSKQDVGYYDDPSPAIAYGEDGLKYGDFDAYWIAENAARGVFPAKEPIVALAELRKQKDAAADWHFDGGVLARRGHTEGSVDLALMAGLSGAAVLCVDAVLTGKVQTAFAAVRPPGHHATPTIPGGFCLINNAAVAARHAQARYGLERVAILDFDVHHGQGTQAVAGPGGTKHSLWVVSDPASCGAVTDAFEALGVIYIADGHHRSAAASRVRKKLKNDTKSHKGDELYNSFLIVSFPGDEVRIYDYNRVVKDLAGQTPEQFMAALKARVSVTPGAPTPSAAGPPTPCAPPLACSRKARSRGPACWCRASTSHRAPLARAGARPKTHQLSGVDVRCRAFLRHRPALPPSTESDRRSICVPRRTFDCRSMPCVPRAKRATVAARHMIICLTRHYGNAQ